MALGIEEFGAALIKTEDLDPIYVALWKTELDLEQYRRLLLAYFCFYHLGVSAWLSEQDDFWQACLVAARNETPSPLGGRWPRGTERRHFRGQPCIQSIEWLSRETPSYWLSQLAETRTLEQVAGAIKEWPLFGPWIAYKMADVLERCVGVPIQFSSDVCLLYKEPKTSLLQLAPNDPEGELRRLISHFRPHKAPPAYDRDCGFVEVETILCKFKSYRNKHYWVGKDIYEVRHGLVGWGDTASRLLKACPPEVNRGGGLFANAS